MAASVFCCLRCCRDGGTGHIPLKEMPAVQLDTQHMGTDVVIVKNGRRICGTGGCLASAPLHQNKSYFEFKIQSTGIWGIGVATQKVNLNQIPLGRDVHSLVMRNDGALYHNNEEKNRLPANSLPQEGDVVGITYDHVELNVYLNGKNMHCPASGIRGTVYPVVYEIIIGEGTGTPLQYFCLENLMDRGAWKAAVHGVAKSWTRLKRLHFHFSLSCIGEGNGNPLQCSCLENPGDGGA
uniref:SPRY domain-containing protein 7 n=1 Tax=Bos taurus TaxID=9913 RepID=A0A3Q1LUD2_BOVIN